MNLGKESGTGGLWMLNQPIDTVSDLGILRKEGIWVSLEVTDDKITVSARFIGK